MHMKKLKCFWRLQFWKCWKRCDSNGEEFNHITAEALLKRIVNNLRKIWGIDERFIEYNNLRKISIGKYVLCGGETAASVISEAVLRLLPGVLGNEKVNWRSFEWYVGISSLY